MARIFLSVIKKSKLVIPAPTAASVIARSGDSKMIQITDMIRLNPMYISMEFNRFFEKLTEIAHAIRANIRIYVIVLIL